MTSPILLSTIGSAGDLLPVLALARALEDRGQPARLALSPDDAIRARAEGFDVIAFGPTEAEVMARLDMTRDELAAQVFANPSPILKRATYPMLAELARELAPEAARARAVAHTLLAMAAPLAAEMGGTPHVPLLLQPMLLRSALDPPRILGFSPPMHRAPTNPVTRSWNRLWLKVIDTEFRRRHAADQARTRRALGLPPTNAVPLFGHAVAPAATLALWDPAFSPIPPDRTAIATGFPHRPGGPLPDALRAFLDAGPAPLVVSPGSVAHRLGGDDYWTDSVALARRASLRAVLLHGDATPPTGPDIFACPAAPHGALFPRAAAILHHGGIGTTGAACRAGKPQLIRPFGADQPDNAARIARTGAGQHVKHLKNTNMDRLLSPESTRAAIALQDSLIDDGAGRAAEALLAAL